MIRLPDGPVDQGTRVVRQDGNADAGRGIFRFETFGNEGFWTDAVRLPAEMVAARVTPLQAMGLGVQIDVDALDAASRSALTTQLQEDPTGRTSALLNDPNATMAAINTNAVIGMPIKDNDGDRVMDANKGDKVEASCAPCHTMTDGSVCRAPNGGSIRRRMDGLANHVLPS